METGNADIDGIELVDVVQHLLAAGDTSAPVSAVHRQSGGSATLHSHCAQSSTSITGSIPRWAITEKTLRDYPADLQNGLLH